MVKSGHKWVVICLLLPQLVTANLESDANFGSETAKIMVNDTNTDTLQRLSGTGRSYYGPLRFSFTSPSYVAYWSCVKMFETTKSWDDNWLCSNRHIGLHWIWDDRAWRTDLKCVATAEPADSRWNDNALCLPVNSNIELVWSHKGRVGQMECLQLYDPAAPAYTHDNFLCWKEH